MNESPEQSTAEMPTLEISTEGKANGKNSDATTQAPQQAALQAALDAPCEVRLSHASGRHVLSIPELGLIVSGKNLETAHAELMAQREKRLREFASEGLLHWLNRPAESGGTAAQPGTLQKLKPFLIKCLVVSVLFLSAVNLLGGRLGDVGYVLEKKLQGLSNWTPEQVEWHRARSEQIAQKLGPTIRELMVMFREQAPVAASATANGVDNATAATAPGLAPAAVAPAQTPVAPVAPAVDPAPAAKAEPAKAAPAKQAPKHPAKP